MWENFNTSCLLAYLLDIEHLQRRNRISLQDKCHYIQNVSPITHNGHGFIIGY